MAIATTTWTTAADTNWITSTGWVSSDPSYKLHQELDAWVTAIGDSSIINIQATPDDATTKSSGNGVAWFLQTRDGDTGSDWGLIFHPRRSDSTSGTTSQSTPLRPSGLSYYGRTPGSETNGYGSYSYTPGGGEGSAAEDFVTYGSESFVAYEASGNLPWFIYAFSSPNGNIVRGIFRLDTDDLESGSYYPSSGISKWISISLGSNYANFKVPIKDVGIPQKGLFSSGTRSLDYPSPFDGENTSGYFFRPYSQYGDVHYLGKISQSLLISNRYTGVWGDTVELNGITYTCLSNYNTNRPIDLWIRTSN
jgi:hypothetical protein